MIARWQSSKLKQILLPSLPQDVKSGQRRQYLETLRDTYLSRGRCSRADQPVKVRVSDQPLKRKKVMTVTFPCPHVHMHVWLLVVGDSCPVRADLTSSTDYLSVTGTIPLVCHSHFSPKQIKDRKRAAHEDVTKSNQLESGYLQVHTISRMTQKDPIMKVGDGSCEYRLLPWLP